MEKYMAVPASDGLAFGPVCRVRRSMSGMGRAVLNPRQEEAAYRSALTRAQQNLDQLIAKASGDEKAIFQAQQVMMADEGLQNEVLAYIHAGAGAAAAVERAAGIFAGRIRALDDDYLRERACDVLDACYRIVDVLDGPQAQMPPLNSPSILAAEELYPTDILSIDRRMILGLVMGAGSANAHASIIARTMDIPAVVLAGQEFLDVCDGKIAAINGSTGDLCLEPDEATKARFAHSIRRARRHTLTEERLRYAACVTRDGTPFELYANCSTVEDVRAAVEADAQGVGLLLSEYTVRPGENDSEEAQYQFYTACLNAAKGKPVTISTYGGNGPEGALEPNPALGLRGIRYSLAHPQWFQTQMAALLRAGVQGNLRVVLPMVSTADDVERALELLHAVKASLRKRRVPFSENVPVGVMIETPAAALSARELARKSAFFHISTTNLAQYAHAADRGSATVQEYFPQFSPAVHRMVSMTVEAAAEARIPVCVCCESAARPELAEVYLRLGVRQLSMAYGSLLGIKEYLMGISL